MRSDEPQWTPPPKDPEKPVQLRRILALFRPYRARLGLVGLLVGASSLVSVASPSSSARSWTWRYPAGARGC